MKNLSFLLGSGFSVPDGMKTVSQINELILSLKLEDIYVHSDMTFMLLNGQKKPGYSSHSVDEYFFITFVSFYNDKVKGQFNYEDFYDYVSSYLRFKNHQEEIEQFVDKFNTEIFKATYPRDALNHLSRFSDNFSKLISSLLQSKKYYEDVSLGNYPNYDTFSFFLKSILDTKGIVNVHSLNHDLLFEHIASKHSDLWQHFTDSYSDLNSSYYGEVHLNESISKTYKVRLKYFTDEYNKPLRLYKLHGSVDTYIANIANPVDLTRVKKDWGVGRIQKEIKSDSGTYSYSELFQFTHPDILSGATSKALWYKQPHYKELIERFRNNLNEAEHLIVIGYGFNDDGINNILETEFLTEGKKMIVVDVKKPTSRLIEHYNIEFIGKSISDVTIEEWLNCVERVNNK